MQKINFLYIITKLELGGAQTQLLTLIKNLDRNRYNVFLFTAKEGLLREDASQIEALTFYPSKFLERPIHPLKDLMALWEMYAFIKDHEIDVVHTHSSKAGVLGRWAAALAGVKAVFHTVHGWSFHDFQPTILRWLFLNFEKMNARLTNKIITISEHDKKKGLANRIGQEGQYALVRYGIDKSPFRIKDPSIRGELGIGENDLIVGTISCFKPQKALGDFMRLAGMIRKFLPRTRFLVVGDGHLRKTLERTISKCDLDGYVMLTGWRRDVPRILAAMDIFVLTSLWEGLPISAIEAMAAGIPVVATHTGGIAEIVEEGKTGALVPCQDMTSMLEKVLCLLRDKDYRHQVGLQARQSVQQRFEIPEMIRESEALYKETLLGEQVIYGG